MSKKQFNIVNKHPIITQNYKNNQTQKEIKFKPSKNNKK
jgi:hypothetical protein